MTTFIWDLDGTLVDSYPAIMEALEVIYQHYGWQFEATTIRTYILQASVGSLLDKLAASEQIDRQVLQSYFSEEQARRDDQIELMPFAKQVLAWTKEQGIANFIYTHKGHTAHQVLEDLGIAGYFIQVLTADSGFRRKPDPQAINYLLDQYDLKPDQCYYIGDRLLDAQLADQAGIRSINLTQPDSPNNQKIQTLEELMAMDFSL